MEMETMNKGHGRETVMTSLRRGVLSKVPSSVLEEMRPMLSSSAPNTTASSKSRRHQSSNVLDFSLRDRSDATAKRGFRVQVPKKLLVYTMVVFFVLPLLLGVFVGTRRILGLHDITQQQQQQPNEPTPPDFWQADEKAEKNMDLETVAKSSSNALHEAAKGKSEPLQEPQQQSDSTTTNTKDQPDDTEEGYQKPAVDEQEKPDEKGEAPEPTTTEKETKSNDNEEVISDTKEKEQDETNDTTDGDENLSKDSPTIEEEKEQPPESKDESDTTEKEEESEKESEEPQEESEPVGESKVTAEDTEGKEETEDAPKDKGDAEEKRKLLRGFLQ